MMTFLALINAVSLVRSLFLALDYNLLLHSKLAEGLFLSGWDNFFFRQITKTEWLNWKPKATVCWIFTLFIILKVILIALCNNEIIQLQEQKINII